MKLQYFILSLLIIVSLVSCAGDGSCESIIPEIEIGKAFENKSNVGLSEYASAIDYIPLETTPGCMLEGADNLLIRSFEDRIYLYSSKSALQMTKTLPLYFKSNGDFVSSIGSFGNSNNEFTNIQTIMIDQSVSQLIVVDYNRFVYYTLDGDFIRFAEVKSNSLTFNGYCSCDNNCIYLRNPSLLDESQGADLLVKVDSMGRVMARASLPRAVLDQPGTPMGTIKVTKGDSSVESTLKYTTGSIKIGDSIVTTFVCEDFSGVKNDVCYMGKNPENADEIALGSALWENYKIGDMVTVSLGEKEKHFKVTGFVQSVNFQGEICELSLQGYMSLCGDVQTPSIYVYLKDTADAEKFTESYKKDYQAMLSDTVNSQKLQKEAQEMYMGITVVLVALIFTVTILIVLFILYIIIKSLLVKRKQELGIYKSMGYTSSQLIAQTIGAFMPVSVIAILLSSAASLFYMPCIYQFVFEAIGVMKNNMEVSFGFLLLFAVVQIIVNIIISVILCMPIRKISAYSLMKE